MYFGNVAQKQSNSSIAFPQIMFKNMVQLLTVYDTDQSDFTKSFFGPLSHPVVLLGKVVADNAHKDYSDNTLQTIPSDVG